MIACGWHAMATMKPLNEKLLATAHFLIARVPPHQLGATKLNKMLWFADCQFYARHGLTITEEVQYVRKDQGPCVDFFDNVIHAMKSRGLIVERPVRELDYVRREFYAQIEPDLSVFTAEEVDILLAVAAQIAPMTAAAASNLSHDELWDETPAYEAIPVAAGAVKVDRLEGDDLEWARKAIQ